MNKISRKILEGMVIGTTLFGNVGNMHAPEISKNVRDKQATEVMHRYRESLYNKIAEEQSTRYIRLPHYSLSPNHCAQYARMSAKKLFGKNYWGADAWNLQYSNSVVYEFKGNEDLKDLIINGVLEPGMLVTSSFPVKDIKKYGRRGKDNKGKAIKDTHVIVYDGVNANGVPEFSHQWGSRIQKNTEEELKQKYNLKFGKILDDGKDLE